MHAPVAALLPGSGTLSPGQAPDAGSQVLPFPQTGGTTLAGASHAWG